MQEEYLSNLEKTLDRSFSKARAFLEAANSFSLLAVRSLIIINSGALFIFPVFLQQLLITESKAVSLLEFATPASFFVLGILLSLFCPLVTYLNFIKNADNQRNRLIIDEYHLAHRHGRLDGAASQRYIEVMDDRVEEARTQEIELSVTINRLYCFGHILGLGSLLCFILGCLSFANAILQLKVI